MFSTDWAATLTGVPLYLLYLMVAAALLALFLLVYLAITRHDEIALIRAGNASAALALSGALLGFCLPLAKAMAQAGAITDLVIWAGLAFIVQLIAYGVSNLVVPALSRRIEENTLSAAITLAAISFACGLISAAAMTE